MGTHNKLMMSQISFDLLLVMCFVYICITSEKPKLASLSPVSQYELSDDTFLSDFTKQSLAANY